MQLVITNPAIWNDIANPEMWKQEWTDITNPEMWKQEWTAFTRAPYIILPFIVAGWLAGWWFRRKISKGTISGLREQVATINESLKLASDRLDRANDDLSRLNEGFQAYRLEVATKGSNASPLKANVAIRRVRDDNLITRSILSRVRAAVRLCEVIPERSWIMAWSIKTFSRVNNKGELDTYLRELFKTPKNRSMEVVHQRAEQIKDRLWRIRYINRGKAMLDQFELATKGKPSSK